MDKIVYALHILEYENGGMTGDTTELYASKNVAETMFSKQALCFSGQYEHIVNKTDTYMSGYDHAETNDFKMELSPIRVCGLPVSEEEMMDEIISRVSGGSLHVSKEILINLGKENYEHCDEMVLLGVLKEYVEDEENKETEVVYDVHLALHFKESHDVLNYAINIECVDLQILYKLYEYVMMNM